MKNDSSASEKPVSQGENTAGARMFPIQGHPTIKRIPWALAEPGREQAMKNHHQTLERLAQRGGLDPGELWCALSGRGLFEQKWTDEFNEWCDGWLVLLVTAPAVKPEPLDNPNVADEKE